MEKLVREELDNSMSSNASLRRSGGCDSRPGTAASRGGSRAPTAKSLYSQGGNKSATSRGRKTAQGSAASLRMESVSIPHYEACQVTRRYHLE